MKVGSLVVSRHAYIRYLFEVVQAYFGTTSEPIINKIDKFSYQRVLVCYYYLITIFNPQPYIGPKTSTHQSHCLTRKMLPTDKLKKSRNHHPSKQLVVSTIFIILHCRLCDILNKPVTFHLPNIPRDGIAVAVVLHTCWRVQPLSWCYRLWLVSECI